MRNALHYIGADTNNNTLSHHGRKGQRWGFRNGPPYPLDTNHQGINSTDRKKLMSELEANGFKKTGTVPDYIKKTRKYTLEVSTDDLFTRGVKNNYDLISIVNDIDNNFDDINKSFIDQISDFVKDDLKAYGPWSKKELEEAIARFNDEIKEIKRNKKADPELIALIEMERDDTINYMHASALSMDEIKKQINAKIDGYDIVESSPSFHMRRNGIGSVYYDCALYPSYLIRAEVNWTDKKLSNFSFLDY